MVNGREYSEGVYGHLPTTERNRLQEVYSPPHNNSAIIDTVYLPRLYPYTYSSSPNTKYNLSIVIDDLYFELLFPGLLGQCISVTYPRPTTRSDHVTRKALAARNNEA